MNRRHRLVCARRNLEHAAEALASAGWPDTSAWPDWEVRREDLRIRLQTALGIVPEQDRPSVNAHVTGVLDRPGYRVEKLVFQTLPGLYATANFYLPANRTDSVPCILYQCGHWPSPDGAKTGYQDRYLWYPANGFALLVLDPLGFGEIPGLHPGVQRLSRWEWLSLGYTPAGVEVWNAMRALDWLESRSEVDASRIGATGISGGGVMTQYLAALDGRIAAVAASCSTFTLGDQAAKRRVPQQCDCTFHPNAYGMDFPDVLALIAPRPLLVLGGRRDPLFPPSGYRAAVRRARRIYDLAPESIAGPARIHLVESRCGHTDTPAMLRDTRAWFCRWLGVQADTSSASPPPESAERLRCCAAIPADARNASIHAAWIGEPSRIFPVNSVTWGRRREELLQILRSQIFGWFPREHEPFKERRVAESGGYAGEWSRHQLWDVETEPGVPIRIRLLTPPRAEAPAPLVVWIKGEGEEAQFPDVDEFHGLLRTHALALVAPRGTERALDSRERAEWERTAGLSGRSLAALQVWDVRRGLAFLLGQFPVAPPEVAVCGNGAAGLAGLYAAAFEPAIAHVVLRRPPPSHRTGFYLPGILRHTDVEEIAALVAPRRLTLLDARTDLYPFARTVYQMIGGERAYSAASDMTTALAATSLASETSPC